MSASRVPSSSSRTIPRRNVLAITLDPLHALICLCHPLRQEDSPNATNHSALKAVLLSHPHASASLSLPHARRDEVSNSACPAIQPRYYHGTSDSRPLCGSLSGHRLSASPLPDLLSSRLSPLKSCHQNILQAPSLSLRHSLVIPELRKCLLRTHLSCAGYSAQISGQAPLRNLPRLHGLRDFDL